MQLPPYRCVSFLALALSLGAVAAQANGEELLPRFGETTAEYEARKKGLPPPRSQALPKSVTLTADEHGHFFIEAVVNGSRLRMVVDTGASVVTLTREDARSAGFRLVESDFKAKASTANGDMLVAPILLKDVTVGDIALHDVPAVVAPENKLAVSLLGMSFLSRLSNFQVSAGRLVLTP